MQNLNQKRDYLKYWRVVRYFIKAKYKIGVGDIDMLLFLYSEGYFNRKKFNEFNEIFPWDKNRFQRLRKDDWIVIFRERCGNKRGTLYEISFKGKRLVNLIYKKLEGEEIPMSKSSNPLFLDRASYSDKVYRNAIKEMNDFIKQQRHHPQK